MNLKKGEMRRIAANIIYPVNGNPVKDAFIEVDDFGRILNIVRYNQQAEEIAGLEFYSGVLIPGFVNAHCHLELSGLKGKINQGDGLNIFIKQVQQLRNQDLEDIDRIMQKALRYMWSRGISGLGDVTNSPKGLNARQNAKMHLHNFVELFNVKEMPVKDIIQSGKSTIQIFDDAGQESSMAPHSMYGTNSELLNEIVNQSKKTKLTTLHFLESHWESLLDSNTIINYLNKLKRFNHILLVHNLNLSKSLFDEIANDAELIDKIRWVLCPNSNRYIKNRQPAVNEFVQWGMRLCLGTDSLASNHQLSILDEMITISEEFPDIPFGELLKWGTLNGAEALGMEKYLGSLEPGKTPGVLLLSGFDLKNSRLTKSTEVSRLV